MEIDSCHSYIRLTPLTLVHESADPERVDVPDVMPNRSAAQYNSIELSKRDNLIRSFLKLKHDN